MTSYFTYYCQYIYCCIKTSNIILVIFRCGESSSGATAFELKSVEGAPLSIADHMQDPVSIVLAISTLFMLCIIIGLALTVCRLKRRPRIKKRYIVNKSVTPLTYRPQSTTEQCEITIENCCNMNVCETVSIMLYYKFSYR